MEKAKSVRRFQLTRETLLGLEKEDWQRVVGGLPQSDFCTQYRHGIGTC